MAVLGTAYNPSLANPPRPSLVQHGFASSGSLELAQNPRVQAEEGLGPGCAY